MLFLRSRTLDFAGMYSKFVGSGLFTKGPTKTSEMGPKINKKSQFLGSKRFPKIEQKNDANFMRKMIENWCPMSSQNGSKIELKVFQKTSQKLDRKTFKKWCKNGLQMEVVLQGFWFLFGSFSGFGPVWAPRASQVAKINDFGFQNPPPKLSKSCPRATK